MAANQDDKHHEQPVIIIKKGNHGGHHGGSWKVALADFAVAMMAFFLVLWLIGGTSQEEKDQIAGYFKRPRDYTPIYDQPRTMLLQPVTENYPAINGSDPVSYSAPEEQLENQGLDTDMKGAIRIQVTDNPNEEALRKLEAELKAEIEHEGKLSTLRNQIYVSATPEGVRLQIIDNINHPMFELGSSDLTEDTKQVLEILAPIINKVPNQISIMGHTDAAQYTIKENFSNWELSVDRANAARRALERGGLDPKKTAQIVGLGSTVLFYPEDPQSPLNRRISIVILNQATERKIQFNNQPLKLKH